MVFITDLYALSDATLSQRNPDEMAVVNGPIKSSFSFLSSMVGGSP